MDRLTHLRTFLDTYRSGSLTRAAQRIGITQPAASAHLQSLETFVGKQLFTRKARGVSPTSAGDELARAIAPHLDALEAKLGALKIQSGLEGTVHIAGPAEYLSARIAAQLSTLATSGLRFRFQIGNREKVRSLLAQGAVDLAITAWRPDETEHGFAEIGRERLLLVGSSELAAQLKGRQVTADLLSELPCVAYDEHLPLVREFFQAVFEAAPTHQAVIAAADLRLIGNALTGNAWSVLPDYLAADHLASGRLVELPTTRQGPDNLLYLVWNKGALRHPRVVHVRDHLIAAAMRA